MKYVFQFQIIHLQECIFSFDLDCLTDMKITSTKYEISHKIGRYLHLRSIINIQFSTVFQLRN